MAEKNTGAPKVYFDRQGIINALKNQNMTDDEIREERTRFEKTRKASPKTGKAKKGSKETTVEEEK